MHYFVLLWAFKVSVFGFVEVVAGVGPNLSSKMGRDVEWSVAWPFTNKATKCGWRVSQKIFST